MKSRIRWMFLVLVLIAGTQLSACAPAQTAGAVQTHEEPFHKEGDNLVLTEQAVKRLDIQTTQLRDEQVLRNFRTWGEVVAQSGSSLAVRVRLHDGDLERVDQTQAATVLLAGGGNPIKTSPPEMRANGSSERGPDMHYALQGTTHGLTEGQYVRVDLPASGGAVQRKIIPYSAVLYDVNGDTWVYTSPEPLTYSRQRVVVDYIDGDLAYLTEGPPANTTIVTVGASELIGAETGVGH